MLASRSDRRAELPISGTVAARFPAAPQSADLTRPRPRRPVRRLALCVACGLVALLLGPVSALAWKPVDHLYAANRAIEPILAGRNVVTLLGKDYAVPAEVATSIRNHPNDYRGGVVGPDAFPDIVEGQGNVHPDTRTDNGTQPQANWTPGHSYAYEWLALVYRAGWDAFKKCGGCAEGQRDLAFTYGYLTHAGEDMWGHTFVNGFARGVFPSVSELGDPGYRGIAIRHIVTEGYVGVHTPATDLAIDAPTGFVYDTFIANPTAAMLGRGVVIDGFLKLRGTLAAKGADLTRYIDSGTLRGCGWPVNWPACAERGYLNAWIEDIDSGLRAYPVLSLKIARDLFGAREANTAALRADVTDYVNAHLISMLGAPDFVGKLLALSTAISRWIEAVADPIIRPLKQLERDLMNAILKAATGLTLDQWVDYLKSPATYVNTKSLGFEADTSTRLDTLMGVKSDKPDAPFDPSKFAAMNDTINMARLILLNGAGLTSLLKAHNAAPYYLSDVAGYPQNIMVQLLASGSSSAAVNMTGWIKSLDGDHQWMAKSPRDGRSYGTGGMYLWNSCNARPVFRALFTDWEHGANNFPDSEDARPCAQVVATGPPANVTKPAIVPFGAPQRCQAGACGPGALSLSPGTWTGGDSVWYSYKWIRLPGPACAHGCVVSSSQDYTLSQGDSRATLAGQVTATNEYGGTTTTVNLRVPALELTAPVVSKLVLKQPIGPIPEVTLTLSKPAELTVTLARPTGTVPCKTFFKDGKGECQDWTPVKGQGAPEGVLRVSATAGGNGVSLRPFGVLSPGRYRIAFEPKDSFGNIGRYASTEFTVPTRCRPQPRVRCQ